MDTVRYAPDYNFFENTINKDFILMQFTGLKDKNGKEIYEGDKIVCEGLELEVKWSDFDAGFSFETWDGHQCVINSHDYEIIGNIYEK